MGRVNSASTEETKDRALKWLLFLPQALLRSSSQEGEAGRGLVAKRFNPLANRRWGDLVARVEADRQRRVEDRGHREPKSQEMEEKSEKEQVLKLLGQGNISKAMARITSNGIADMSSPTVREQVKAKHPARAKEIQATVVRKAPVQHLRGLREALLALRRKKGSSPGVGGCRGEYLVTLAELLEADKMQQLEDLCLYDQAYKLDNLL